MNKKYFLFLLYFIFSCKVDLRQFPYDHQKIIFENDKGVTIYIGSFHIAGIFDSFFNREMEEVFITFIEKSKKFEKVSRLPDNTNIRAKRFYIVDVDIDPMYSEKINWWLSWPAIYPGSGYWPFQVVTANFNLSVRIKIYDKNGLRKNHYEAVDFFSETLVFYGFYRTSYIEKKMRDSYTKLYYELSHKLSNQEFLEGKKY